MLGWMHEAGEGVEPDVEEAERWYALAAEQGHPAAKSRLASGSAPGPALPTDVAEAIELAGKYLSAKVVLDVAIPFAEMGANVHLGDQTITEKNVRQFKRDYKQQLKTYRQEIRRRGYPKIAGTYTSETTESCARIHSSMAELAGDNVTRIEITQEGFEAEIHLVFTEGGEEFSLGNPAVVVDQGIAMVDELNTDYYFWGVVDDESITLSPNVSVLDGWPQWAGPPQREDLEECTITLEQTDTSGKN